MRRLPVLLRTRKNRQRKGRRLTVRWQQAVLDAGVLPLLLVLLHGDLARDRLIIRRGLRVLANICAGPRQQLQVRQQ
eukprot:SAG22_NODE_684_length_7918_cov_6.380356_13_plen_77_part_00